jgi:CMP-N-acetylneuraminic acid synthetase
MINVAIIPARGGSKRIYKKNIREFCGKPIIAYSIEAAINSGMFDRVIVSTDDQNIADIAKEYGAETPFMRPMSLADDHTGTNDVVAHAINALEQLGETLGYVCCIYATAPF